MVPAYGSPLGKGASMSRLRRCLPAIRRAYPWLSYIHDVSRLLGLNVATGCIFPDAGDLFVGNRLLEASKTSHVETVLGG